MGFNYTVDQQKVIELRNRNILVAAAAGSGKTAVLVERIIRLITEGEEPVSIDRLLIVTFTSAAASEMRERIGKAIEGRLAKEQWNEHLQKQATLIHNAPITTISSFCLGLVKNHFHDISLDPSFRVADEAECKLLKQDVLGDLLEEYFVSGDEKFIRLVEVTSPNGREQALEELILKLHESSRSNPFPQKWLESCGSSYEVRTGEYLEESQWMKTLIAYCKMVLTGCGEQLGLACHIAHEPDGPYMYAELLEQEQEIMNYLASLETFAELSEGILKNQFARLPSKKDESVNGDKRELAKGMRNQVKAEVEKLKSEFFYAPMEEQVACMRETAPVVEMLIEVVISFAKKFQEKKQERGILDFADMEQYALRILLEEREGTMVPSDTARMYQEYYYEVLIDEYQDSNLVQEYLLKSISKESSGAYNQFMVGDVKQSIYKFRLARPELFLEKYHAYHREESRKQKIDLQMNFRSREEVLECANYIFRQIMTPQIGGVTYDEKAMLNVGASYATIEGQDQTSELLLIERGEKTSDAKELEAKMIAKRIHQLVESFYVVDNSRESGKRLARYSDVVILLRSNTGWDDTFKRVLEEEGIPTHITSKTGYFSVYEVQLVLNYLRILDNPLQDIPLTSVMLSGVIGFTEEELAQIQGERRESKGGGKHQYLYRLLEWYTTYGKNERIVAKIKEFLANIHNYREITPYTSVHELIQRFLHEMDFYLYLTTLPRGEQRSANLAMLLEKAIEFEQTSYHGLFHFIRYIEQMEKFEVSFGEANLLDEHADVVRIMSVHKSKGLEFPICFVSGMHKKFNQMDLRKQFVVDMDLGIGMDAVDPIRRTKTKTVRKSAILRKMFLDNIGEEIRILYVALTRAKEKLIMTGVTEDVEKSLSVSGNSSITNMSQLPFLTIKNAGSFLDMVLATWCEKQTPFVVRWESEEACERHGLARGIQRIHQREHFRTSMEHMSKDGELEAYMKACFTYEYPYQALGQIYSKTTVTEIKKKRMLEELEDAVMLFETHQEKEYIPSFIKEEKVSGTQRGNAYHKAMEVLDLLEEGGATVSIERQVACGRMKKAYGELIQVEKLERFLETSLGKRMQEAQRNGCLYREQPFVIAIPANEVETQFPMEEEILLQGIVDAYFEENGELVIVDYKTDRVNSCEELMARYVIQLEYYAKALSALTGKPVKEKVLYSFYLEEVCS